MNIPFRHLGDVPAAALFAELARRGLMAPTPADDTVTVGELTVDPLGCEAVWRGEQVTLTQRETQMLYALAKARWQGRRWVRSDWLAVRVWHAADRSAMACVSMYAHYLRKKLPGLLVHKGGRSVGVGAYSLDVDGAQESAA